MPDIERSPAEHAAEETRRRVFECIDKGESFLLEAGAGAGKTYSLIETLRYLVEERGSGLLRRRQRVACITYTNVASDEIRSRTDGHRAVLSSTIHAFCWSLIKDFQPFLREKVPELPGWPERLEGIGDLGARRVDYNLGYPVAKKDDERISLGHDDVLYLTVALMELPKFRRLFTARYPILLIDEYQDTNAAFANSLTAHFLATNEKMLIGFFGDHWQRIYDDTCGKIEHRALRRIDKGANFRSAPAIVAALNRMRPELPQAVSEPTAQGSVAVYHTNGWSGPRRAGNNWGGDLWPEVGTKYVDSMIEKLGAEGWSSDPNETKYLLLTHRILAARQGYSSFVEIFPYNEAFLRKEDPHVAFLVDTVEPVAVAYQHQRFGEMFAALGTETPHISGHAAKVDWTKDLDVLLELREKGTIGDVIDHLRRTQRPRVPDAVEQRESDLEQQGREGGNPQSTSIELLQRLRKVAYHELIALARFIDEKTPFATKHGVKGAEFENVLVVFGRGWFKYNFVQFLEWAGDPQSIPPSELETFERNRNLFYVVCSRPRKRLAIMFTQEVTEKAMRTLNDWFGSDAIHALDIAV